MLPTVLFLGNTTNPSFGLLPAAKGYTLPSLGLTATPHPGDRDDYHGSLKSLIHNLIHFELNSAFLAENSMNLTLQNTGSSIVDFKIVAVTLLTI